MVMIKIKCILKTKLFQNVKFTLENEITVILATTLMKQLTVTLAKISLLFALYNHCVLALQFC